MAVISQNERLRAADDFEDVQRFFPFVTIDIYVEDTAIGLAVGDLYETELDIIRAGRERKLGRKGDSFNRCPEEERSNPGQRGDDVGRVALGSRASRDEGEADIADDGGFPDSTTGSEHETRRRGAIRVRMQKQWCKLMA